MPELRPGSAAYDGRYKVPTFAEVLDFAAGQRTCKASACWWCRRSSTAPTSTPSGSMEEKVVRELRRRGLDGRRSTVIIQSFEIRNLKELNRKLDVPLVQLVDCAGAPADRVAIGDPTTYADMVTPAGLRKIARYADQLGACKNLMIPRQSDGTLGEPTSVIRDAHRAGLTVTGWTFRAENEFLPIEFRSGDNPAAYGDMAGEIRAFVRAGMDAFFTDQPDLGVAALRR
ncbi:MAG: glycerophosphodiester phosphodiesterase family protein [Micropruina sp.]